MTIQGAPQSQMNFGFQVMILGDCELQ